MPLSLQSQLEQLLYMLKKYRNALFNLQFKTMKEELVNKHKSN